MFCENCGKRFPDDGGQKFCDACGTKLHRGDRGSNGYTAEDYYGNQSNAGQGGNAGGSPYVDGYTPPYRGENGAGDGARDDYSPYYDPYKPAKPTQGANVVAMPELGGNNGYGNSNGGYYGNQNGGNYNNGDTYYYNNSTYTPPSCAMDKAYGLYWRRFFDFAGRSTRSEFWWVFLVNFLIDVVLSFLGVYQAGLIFAAVCFIPTLALAVRRLHDTNRSGVLLLLGFIPFIGAIVLLMFFIQPSSAQSNYRSTKDLK